LLGNSEASPVDVLTDLISRAHEAILNRARSKSKLKGMGTTLVLLAIVSAPAQIAYLAHVGDSRAYRFRSGTLTPLTKDHTLIEKYLERGILTAESAKTHPERHVLTRALGVGSTVHPTVTAYPILPEDLGRAQPDSGLQPPRRRSARPRRRGQCHGGGGRFSFILILLRC
jgi:protein phosphatase